MKKGLLKFWILTLNFILLGLFVAPLAQAQSIFDSFNSYALQQMLTNEFTIFILWFLVFFSVIFFGVKKVLNFDNKTSGIFSVAFSLLLTVSILNTYPNITQNMGSIAIIILVAALALFAYSFFKKPENQSKFKLNWMWVAALYLIFWYLLKFTDVLPYSIKGMFSPYQNAMDIIALAGLAILIVLGMKKLSEKVSLEKLPHEAQKVEQKVEQAKQLEQQGKPEEAAKAYQEAVQQVEKVKRKTRTVRKRVQEEKGRFFTSVGMNYKSADDIKKRYGKLMDIAQRKGKNAKLIEKLRKRMDDEIGRFAMMEKQDEKQEKVEILINKLDEYAQRRAKDEKEVTIGKLRALKTEIERILINIHDIQLRVLKLKEERDKIFEQRGTVYTAEKIGPKIDEIDGKIEEDENRVEELKKRRDSTEEEKKSLERAVGTLIKIKPGPLIRISDDLIK